LRSWTKRERAYKIPGVKTKRGKKRILLVRTQRGGNSISINFLKENIFSVFWFVYVKYFFIESLALG
jgi:hypothetical protein